MEKKKFDTVGDVEDKVIWNSAGTRKWRMTYTLLEIQPSWRRKAKPEAKAEGESNKKASKPKAKKSSNSKKASTSKAKSKNGKTSEAKPE